MSDITINAKAYCKLILHAAKYPHAAVNGILLAKTSNKSKELEFVDAIPLFHIALNLTPMAEIALTQVMYCDCFPVARFKRCLVLQIDHVAAQSGLTVAGYYTAHENLKENSFEKAYNRVADKIAENFGAACLIVVDNSKLGSKLKTHALKIAQFSDGKFRPLDAQKIVFNPSDTTELCAELLNQKAYEDLVDFDNHLDDISQDWMNHNVNRLIKEAARQGKLKYSLKLYLLHIPIVRNIKKQYGKCLFYFANSKINNVWSKTIRPLLLQNYFLHLQQNWTEFSTNISSGRAFAR